MASVRKLLAICLLLAPLAANGADSLGIRRHISMPQARILVPRPAFDPVKSLIPGEQKHEGDTVDTANPSLKIVLLPNGTWYYAKDGKEAGQADVFRKDWSSTEVVPYKTPLAELPYRITLVLSDQAGGFCCPYGVKVFSPFGRRHARSHNGVDLPMPRGSEIYAAFDGKVRVSTYHRGFGNMVIIRHENGMETTYAHLSQRKVESGQWVSAGDLIGLCGSTGRSTGPHLHFETRYCGFAFDPQWIIDFENGVLRHGVFTLRRAYLTSSSRYVPESMMEEEQIYMSEEQERAEAERIAAEKAKEVWHTVKSGDTLSRIAVRYGTSVSAICKLNGISASATLNIGRKLRVR